MLSTRRDLIKLGALAAGATALPRLVAAASTGATEKARKPLRILILGGTGFTGPFQVNYALARGHTITLFNRGKRPAPEWPGEVEQLFGDRETGDLKALEGREWDVCIDNPTSVPHWVRDAGKVLRGKVGQYVFISTISVYADNSRPNMDETGALAQYTGKDVMAETRATLIADVANLYGPLKAACEAEAEKQFPGKTTVIRPGFIVGPRDDSDRFTYWPLRVAEGGDVLVPGDGSDPVQFIDARDLAEWTIRMVENGTTGIFNATGPDYRLSTDAFLHGVRAVTGGRANFVHVPTAFLREQKVSFGGDLPIWLPAEGESEGFAQVNIQRAIDTGMSFRPLADTVRDLLAWWNTLPAERRAQPRAGMTRAREAELLAAWKAKQTA
jgi:2'-hydroxyisoflavone reductase